MESSQQLSQSAQQLAELRSQIRDENPQIYRHWALYLQVLRQDLRSIVERTFFHLAVEVHPERYRAMGEQARLELHHRLSRLVQRTCSLLTVEQLQALAAQTERRLRRQALRQQQRLMASMEPSAADLFESAEGPSRDAQADPPGSISLGMALPISFNLFGPSAAGSASAEDRQEPEQLRQMLSQLLESGQDDWSSAGIEQGSSDGLMPETPQQLLRWFDACDAALAQRLRNLSHGINVELVRLGLSSALIPLPMLEAVADGQLETLNAPLHLARVNLPPVLLCVLLRPADLEADRVRLRTCRSRLQQSRQQVRRMAQTYQRLERRLQALEAEQLWLHDHSTARPTGSPPTL